MSKNQKHPKGLPYLFLTEMWERFGYYLMIGIFTLYLKDAELGFGMNEKQASDLYGTFIALVFFTPFLGGLIADRYLGYTKSIYIGGFLMGTGYCLMSVHDVTTLYIAMTLVILGNGFFKPNISTLLGNLYNNVEFQSKKDEGYSLFYMGINIGAFVCNFFGAVLYNMIGWNAAFIAAGVGMFIALIIFYLGTSHVKYADFKKEINQEESSLAKILLIIVVPAVIFGLLGYFFMGVEGPGNTNASFFGSDTTDAFIAGCIPVIVYFFNLWKKAVGKDKLAIGALLTIYLVVIPFWAVFKQNGSTLNTWIEKYTNREINQSVAPTLDMLYLVEKKTFRKDSLPEVDNQFRATGKTIVDYPIYFKNYTNKEKEQLSDGQEISLINTSIFQSVNPFWVIVLTPLVIAIFTFLRSRRKEPSTPLKLAIGLFITALSCVVMVGAVYASNNGLTKSSALWFIFSYFILTFGELCISPMGLSVVSKISPKNCTAVMMGGWFLATSIGNKMSGVMSSMWDNYENKANFFWVNFVLLVLASAIMLLFIKKLNAVLTNDK